MKRWLRRHGKKLGATLAVVLLAPVAAHYGIRHAARLEAPATTAPPGEVERTGSLRKLGRSYVRSRGAILEVRLAGSPTEIGHAHARLLRDEMVATERVVWELFESHVPSALSRLFLMDLAMLRYRSVDHGVEPARREEIAAQARAFAPDPFDDVLPTYQRFIYLNALYDISLSFEGSPLIGCTTFTLRGDVVAGGDTLLARAFDFEAHDVYDEKKAVFLVLEDGAIPFASVSWPGLVGVVSGMNAEGVAVVVHGARAGEPRAEGEPVVHALRRTLGRATSTEQAVAALGERQPMVSHIVVVADSSGHVVAVERIPGQPPHVRRLGERAVVTNHLEGPGAADPKNERVRLKTSTLARRKRGDEIVSKLRHEADIPAAVALLRDRRGAGGAQLPLGDRNAIDALIATHGVVANTTTRTLWVSESPHLLGRFVAFDLKELLSPGYSPAGAPNDVVNVRADPLLTSGEYAAHSQKVPKAPMP